MENNNLDSIELSKLEAVAVRNINPYVYKSDMFEPISLISAHVLDDKNLLLVVVAYGEEYRKLVLKCAAFSE